MAAARSTLLRHVTGMILPNSGECITLGRPAPKLGRAELARIGAVDQDGTLLEWMRGDHLLHYVSTFYERWDGELERSLVASLEVDVDARIGTMSPGNLQKLWLIVATCHHPELLLLDEPLSALDPSARQTMIMLLLERFSSDDMTIVISSHMLRDIEPVVNRIICLERGRVVADDELDALRERYAEWIVTSATAGIRAAGTEGRDARRYAHHRLAGRRCAGAADGAHRSHQCCDRRIRAGALLVSRTRGRNRRRPAAAGTMVCGHCDDWRFAQQR